MKTFSTRYISLAVFSVVLASCDGGVAATIRAEDFYGRWDKRELSLPPVSLEVRREGGATVGQVWLSGVTYTLPAVLDDTSVVLANPTSSALAPFVAVIQKDGSLRATIRGQPDAVATLHKTK